MCAAGCSCRSCCRALPVVCARWTGRISAALDVICSCWLYRRRMLTSIATSAVAGSENDGGGSSEGDKNDEDEEPEDGDERREEGMRAGCKLSCSGGCSSMAASVSGAAEAACCPCGWGAGSDSCLLPLQACACSLMLLLLVRRYFLPQAGQSQRDSGLSCSASRRRRRMCQRLKPVDKCPLSCAAAMAASTCCSVSDAPPALRALKHDCKCRRMERPDVREYD